MLSLTSEVGRLIVNGECMTRQDRHAKRPPLEIPVEMLAEIKPVAPKRVLPKPHHSEPLAPVPPKLGLPT
jgi:hypothetical protein